VTDLQGNVYFTTLRGGLIMKMDAGGVVSNWARATCPNGQLIVPNGDHLICDSGNSSISRYDSGGHFLGNDILHSCDGQSIHCPNDLAIDADGGIYFTDSIRGEGKVCYYSPNGEERVIAINLDFPNGIALADQGKLLLVAESYCNRIVAFHLRSPGIPEGTMDVFATLPSHPSGYQIMNLPDGIRLDDSGNLWVAHYGMRAVQVLSPKGEHINSIRTEFPLPSNLCLYGDVLFVTGGYNEPGPGGISMIEIAGICE